MAHYGMYVNDTDGINNIELEAESDISYTSLGGASLMNNFIKAKGGSYYAPLKRWILSGRFIPVNRLRVIGTCFAQGTCPGSPARTSNTRARIAGVTSIQHLARHGHGTVAELRFAGR
jgi:hypothetical protein